MREVYLHRSHQCSQIFFASHHVHHHLVLFHVAVRLYLLLDQLLVWILSPVYYQPASAPSALLLLFHDLDPCHACLLTNLAKGLEVCR